MTTPTDDAGWPRAARVLIRTLAFRATREELLALGPKELGLGLTFTWLVGMGRYWDAPAANLLQHLGVGSVAYVFALSTLLWLLIWPLGPEAWSYKRLLTFVTLTSPPALLYAIPVERFVTLDTATTMNVWFLATVATWRVALLVFYLRRLAQLRTFALIVATLLPLTLIVTGLTALNLERAVFEIMGGLPDNPTSNDAAYGVLFALTMLSSLLWIPLLLCYVTLIFQARRRRARNLAAPDNRI